MDEITLPTTSQTPASQPDDFDALFLSSLTDEKTPTDSTPSAPPIVADTKEAVNPTINIEEIKHSLRSLQNQLNTLIRKLEGTNSTHTGAISAASVHVLESNHSTDSSDKILEGLFNGEKFIDADGHEYHVPPNYASKSKLLIGDRMKLTITPSGSFIYKQIGPAERRRAVGVLQYDAEHNKWMVEAESRQYKVLTASISFYKGKPGDEVILLVPQNGVSDWGAVDNIISK